MLHLNLGGLPLVISGVDFCPLLPALQQQNEEFEGVVLIGVPIKLFETGLPPHNA